MNGIKNILLPVTAMTLILLSGCAIRPKDGTTIINSNLSYRVSNGVFELKEVTTLKSENKNLLGWRGNELEVWDKSGIYLINYKTTAFTTLLSLASGQMIGLPPILSANGKRIVFSILQKANSYDWYIADSDCETNKESLSKVIGYSTRSCLWSGKAKYICTPNSSASYCNIYDVSGSFPSQAQKIKFADLNNLFDINDQTDQLLLSQYQSSSLSLCISNTSGSVIQVLDSNSYATKASFVSKDSVAYLSSTSFDIVKTDQLRQRQTYSDVKDYALSPDKNYICLLRNNSSDTCDVYIGSLQNGQIANLSLIYKGFDQNTKDEIFFSQDDKRVGISSYERVASKGKTTIENTVTVLTFQ